VRAALIGATGLIGYELAPLLVRDGRRVEDWRPLSSAAIGGAVVTRAIVGSLERTEPVRRPRNRDLLQLAAL
jgi:aspartate-semialdehyde dehydrogenase